MIVVSHSHSGPMLSLDSYRSMIWTWYAELIRLLKMAMNSSQSGNWSRSSVRQTTVESLTMRVRWWVLTRACYVHSRFWNQRIRNKTGSDADNCHSPRVPSRITDSPPNSRRPICYSIVSHTSRINLQLSTSTYLFARTLGFFQQRNHPFPIPTVATNPATTRLELIWFDINYERWSGRHGLVTLGFCVHDLRCVEACTMQFCVWLNWLPKFMTRGKGGVWQWWLYQEWCFSVVILPQELADILSAVE